MLSSLQYSYKMTLFGKVILCGLEIQNYLGKISLNLVASSWNMIPYFSREFLGLYFRFVNAFFLNNILALNYILIRNFFSWTTFHKFVCNDKNIEIWKIDKALFWSKLSQSFYVKSRNLASFTQVFIGRNVVNLQYGNMYGLSSFQRGIQNYIDRWPKMNILQGNYSILCIARVIKNWTSI